MRASISVIEPATGAGDASAVHWCQVILSAELTQALVPGIHGHEMGYERRSCYIEQRFACELGICLE